MESAKQQITSSLQKAIKDLTGLEIIPQLEHPADEKHGDYSSNIALTLFGKVSKGYGSAMELAENMAETLSSCLSTLNFLGKVEAVEPGFINFWLSKEYLVNQLSLIQSKTPQRQRFAGQRIMVEFTDPNPFKEFHIGHLYSNAVGEAICRLLRANGAIVKVANYQGDIGLHVAKSLYGIFHLCHAELILPVGRQVSASQIFENKILKPFGLAQDRQVQDDSLNKRIKFLGEAYAFGAKIYEEDENAKKEIEELNKKIYDKEPTIIALYEKGRRWSLEYFESIYKRLGTKFDFYYFESEVGKDGLELVRKYIKKGVFEESEGAIIFSGEKYGLHNRVFINSLGLPTYEAKDLGLAITKYKDFPYDLSIIITANEQSDYFRVVLYALSKISEELAHKTKHIAHGVVRLPIGKISSRTGTIITGEWLLDEVKRRIQSQYKEMDEETSEKVAVGGVKYALLKSGIGRDIAFDFDESISLEGNSGPYLQYTFARTQSVLAKIKNQKSKIKSIIQNSKFENEEMSLLRALNRFPEVVEEAAGKFAPNLLCNYLFDLAQKFNLFYQKHKILSPVILNFVKNPSQRKEILSYAQDDNTQEFRLALTAAVGQVIKNGLYLLGIQAPERM